MITKTIRSFFSTLVLAEHNGKTLSKNSLKLLSAAEELKEQKDILLCGSNLNPVIQNIKQTTSGIRKIYTINTEHILADEISSTTSELIKQQGYTNVVSISNNFGKDLIPRLAGIFQTQPISDIIQIKGKNQFIRPTYAGNAFTRVTTKYPLNFLTFRPASYEEAKEGTSSPQVKELTLNKMTSEFVSEDKNVSEKPELTTARIVVSGGRGVKSKQNFKLIEDLADAFQQAAVGASRAAVDSQFCPNELQIGQTGKIVAPELYIAVGISGAVQHLAGMKDSKVIVAINNRPDEPIFEIANYGLEGDLFQVVPELTQKIKAIKQSQ